MERIISATIHLDAPPEEVVHVLSTDPAGVLAGTPGSGTESFAAEIAVALGGGASVSEQVDVTFGRLSDRDGVARFGLSWRAREHQGAFPRFGGDLEVHADGQGTLLRLAGHYSPPLGLLGTFGDGLVGHRLARRVLQGFLREASVRISGLVRAGQLAAAVTPGHADPIGLATCPELYLG